MLWGGVAPSPAAAQSREDSAAVWLDASRELRESGQPGAANALLELLQRRFAGTAAATEAGRLLTVASRQPEPERPGRVELLVWSATYGLWLGVAIPVIAKADEPEVYGLGVMLGAPAAFLAARQYLKSHPLTEGQARAITFGGSWGTWQGFGWTEVLSPGREEICNEFGCYEESGTDAEALMAGAVIGGLAGIGTGAMLARKPISSGVATTVSFGATWGAVYGFALGALTDLEDDDLLVAGLAGGDAGLLAMALLAPRWNPSLGQARLVSLGGVVGGLAGLGLDLIIQPDDENVAILIPTVTSAAGLLVAANSLRSRGSDDGGNDPGAGGGSSLLDYRHGRWQLRTPALGLKVERERQQKAKTSLYVPLLQATF